MAAYSYLDIRNRHVPNSAALFGGAFALAVVILSGHLLAQPLLHLSAVIFVPMLSYFLFRIGAFGGADVKILSVVAIASPGFELLELDNPLFESILSAGIQMLFMLLGGYLYARTVRNHANSPPLIPFFLLGYLTIQILSMA